MTVKHFGGEVRRGGAILNFGLPFTFFADTTDIWLYPRRARLLTTWAGPYTTLVVAGGFAIASLALPRGTAGGFLLLMAAVLYLSAVFNLNPLINNDGYQMLSDVLDISGLSAKAVAFVRQRLLGRLRDARAGRPLSREEIVLSIYGRLASLWSFIALGLLAALWFWRVGGWAGHTWDGAGWPGRLLLVAGVAVVVVPPLLFPLTLAWQALRRGWTRLALVSAGVREQQLHEAERLLAGSWPPSFPPPRSARLPRRWFSASSRPARRSSPRTRQAMPST